MIHFGKKIFLYFFVFAFPLFAQSQTNKPETNQDTSKKSGSSLTSRLKVLELAGEFLQTPSEGGPQSVSSILNSARVAASFANTNTANNQLMFSTPVNKTDLTMFQSKEGLSRGLGGASLTYELGLVWKFFETFGLKYGGFYQISSFSISEVSGYNWGPGKTPVELSSVSNINSSQSSKEFGSFGANVSIVKNF
ncbi:hypothetical protein EHQ31_13290 [Leptospira montravelensis]|uniref:Uncharacterized protein n=1 Tax=Leptospira montravelensis TaxID=2484961 RepID=A0ABY2LRL9_9LEPT|nr:hypothetical protein [Leptospira montravelensis]TGK80669.1 hypothetical protein EHQ19_13535 [Leptospira montravelensis]TGL01741.1 hypothetical protein EHQ31_13290 [Leptospira montravelensis]